MHTTNLRGPVRTGRRKCGREDRRRCVFWQWVWLRCLPPFPGWDGSCLTGITLRFLFEALFILTTIDAGTRVGRFVLQELLGKVFKPFEHTDSVLSTIVASLVIVGGWVYFILTGSVSTIWPMFGIANQLLAVIALTVGSMVIINMGKGHYVWVTAAPLAFISTTTLTAGWQSIWQNFIPLAQQPGKAFTGYLNTGLTVIMMACVLFILANALQRVLKSKVLAHAE